MRVGQLDRVGAVPVRCAIIRGPVDEPTEAITTRQEVDQMPEAVGMTPEQRARLGALAEADQPYPIADALERTRNTVVAAVDGDGGPREGDFVANAWRLRGHVSAYDPEMKDVMQPMLTARNVPGATSTVVRGSVTQFGGHVPYTDVLVPHPGPWVKLGPPDDLATCLEAVLGRHSRAYVLTDNETALSYAATLTQRITDINQQKAQNQGYVPLAAQVTVVTEQYVDGKPHTTVGGADLALGHQPGFRLILVTRD